MAFGNQVDMILRGEGRMIKNIKFGWLVLAAGIICLVAGLAMGQYVGVFRKAIFICLECIGIG